MNEERECAKKIVRKILKIPTVLYPPGNIEMVKAVEVIITKHMMARESKLLAALEETLTALKAVLAGKPHRAIDEVIVGAENKLKGQIMNRQGLKTKILVALSDPKAPWYGSDLIELVSDYIIETDVSKAKLLDGLTWIATYFDRCNLFQPTGYHLDAIIEKAKKLSKGG